MSTVYFTLLVHTRGQNKGVWVDKRMRRVRPSLLVRTDSKFFENWEISTWNEVQVTPKALINDWFRSSLHVKPLPNEIFHGAS